MSDPSAPLEGIYDTGGIPIHPVIPTPPGTVPAPLGNCPYCLDKKEIAFQEETGQSYWFCQKCGAEYGQVTTEPE